MVMGLPVLLRVKPIAFTVMSITSCAVPLFLVSIVFVVRELPSGASDVDELIWTEKFPTVVEGTARLPVPEPPAEPPPPVVWTAVQVRAMLADADGVARPKMARIASAARTCLAQPPILEGKSKLIV